jgi:hypothetical protein
VQFLSPVGNMIRMMERWYIWPYRETPKEVGNSQGGHAAEQDLRRAGAQGPRSGLAAYRYDAQPGDHRHPDRSLV